MTPTTMPKILKYVNVIKVAIVLVAYYVSSGGLAFIISWRNLFINSERRNVMASHHFIDISQTDKQDACEDKGNKWLDDISKTPSDIMLLA